ncbi:MAG: hypothetical protein NC231_07100 [Bacillus sp. (in: Bacteria)]|nr:hypothetical protein [Bacillus sp. (in: firmicutes)]MCM1425939.1 hypothetical protein [Eubacterium sp.]
MAVKLKNIKVLCLFALLMLLLAGCGKKDEALEEYQANMETFFEHIIEFNDNMNAIDVVQPDYLTQMLEYLDALDAEMAWMAQLEVPEQFSAVDNLADEASENMTQAVLFYHMAYENDEYDANVEEAAKEYYDRANLRIQYIITILHGGVPEGEGITYTEDESIFGSGYMNQTDEDDSSGQESGNEDEGAENQGGESGAEPEAGNE